MYMKLEITIKCKSFSLGTKQKSCAHFMLKLGQQLSPFICFEKGKEIEKM